MRDRHGNGAPLISAAIKPESELVTAGYCAARPIKTNHILEGRARIRRAARVVFDA